MLYEDALLRELEDGLRGALPAWGLPAETRLRLLVVSENATFLAEPSDGPALVLRVHRPNYHDAAEIRSELAWIEALRAEAVVETPRPLPAREGGPLVSFQAAGAWRHAVAFEHMGGREPDPWADRIGGHRRLGAIAAALHVHARRWRRPDGFTRKRWTFETIVGDRALWGDWRAAPGLAADGRDLLERLHARLARDCEAFGASPDRFGLIHCDMRSANLLADGDRLGLIDFDDCGFSWFGYDFAGSISFLEHDPIVPALMAAWLDGYRSVAPFAPEQERALPMFVMLRRLQLTAWIASHAETATAQETGSDFTQGTLALALAYLAIP